ncbi:MULTISPECIES: cysteine hydrolase family protein [Gordonibacter]|uniref:Cysteine hydrolase n=1 Tax=Gordonibacter faecis TaxID=3047475 RepID=A0ABT7DKW7_9ACTN|nr:MULTISPECIES: cysteine hydrolase [unclassified Gordonibacter]MDJ1650174.1 cysteine hydrolase [Gordonibacter sp. KGMB12511]
MVEAGNAALLLIDMQNGFVDPNSALCVEGAAATVPACSRALDRARELGMPVFHVVREYAEDGSDVEAVRHTAWHDGGKPVSRACVNPHSLDEPAPLAPQPGDRVVVKPRFSAFFNTNLDNVLRRLGVNTVVLAGTTTPNCIRTTCYDALSLDYNVVVLEDCTSSRTPAVQAANIEDMAHIGAQMLTCDDFCTHGLDNVRDITAEVAAAVREMRPC